MDFEELKKIALAAPQGRWAFGKIELIPGTGGWNTFELEKVITNDGLPAEVIIKQGNYEVEVFSKNKAEYGLRNCQPKEIAAFIAAFNPQIVLSFIEEIEAARNLNDVSYNVPPNTESAGVIQRCYSAYDNYKTIRKRNEKL